MPLGSLVRRVLMELRVPLVSVAHLDGLARQAAQEVQVSPERRDKLDGTAFQGPPETKETLVSLVSDVPDPPVSQDYQAQREILVSLAPQVAMAFPVRKVN